MLMGKKLKSNFLSSVRTINTTWRSGFNLMTWRIKISPDIEVNKCIAQNTQEITTSQKKKKSPSDNLQITILKRFPSMPRISTSKNMTSNQVNWFVTESFVNARKRKTKETALISPQTTNIVGIKINIVKGKTLNFKDNSMKKIAIRETQICLMKIKV